MVVLQSSTIQNGIWNTAIIPAAEQDNCYDAHCLLCIVHAVTEAVDRRRKSCILLNAISAFDAEILRVRLSTMTMKMNPRQKPMAAKEL